MTNVKTVNSIDKRATIFSKLDQGQSHEEVAQWAGIKVESLKTYYLPHYNRSKGKVRKSSLRGSNVLKSVKTYAFDVVKVDSMNNIAFGNVKFPIMGATTDEISYAGIDFGQVVVKTISPIEFKSLGCRLTK